MQDVLSRKRSPRLIPQVSYLVDPSDAISALRASQPRDLISAEKEKVNPPILPDMSRRGWCL
jgi:hypothetical protein